MRSTGIWKINQYLEGNPRLSALKLNLTLQKKELKSFYFCFYESKLEKSIM